MKRENPMVGSAAGPVLALDIGGSKVVAAVVGADGSIGGKTGETLRYPLSKDDLTRIIVRLGREAMGQCAGDIRCVGVAVPGLADPARGVWEYSSFSGIRDFPVADLLAQAFGFPVYIDNDVNACALGEMCFGACAGVSDFLWVTVSNGIGGCPVVGGKILAGASGHAGEIGHIVVEEGGHPCQCGNRGCAEACAAGPAILRRYLERAGYAADEGLDARAIAEKARRGDEDARAVFDETGYYLGKAVAAAVNILNPRKVVFGGGVAMSMDLFYPRLMSTLDGMVFRAANQALLVERTALGYDAALLGAAAVGAAKISVT